MYFVVEVGWPGIRIGKVRKIYVLYDVSSLYDRTAYIRTAEGSQISEKPTLNNLVSTMRLGSLVP